MDMPMDIAFEQAKQNIAQVVNYCLSDLKLPMFLVSVALDDIQREVKAQKDFEYNAHVHEYNESLKTSNEEQSESEENENKEEQA